MDAVGGAWLQLLAGWCPGLSKFRFYIIFSYPQNCIVHRVNYLVCVPRTRAVTVVGRSLKCSVCVCTRMLLTRIFEFFFNVGKRNAIGKHPLWCGVRECENQFSVYVFFGSVEHDLVLPTGV